MKKLLIYILLSLGCSECFSQTEVRLGTVNTTTNNAAVLIGLSYIRSLDSIWKTRENFLAGKNYIFGLTPEVNIQTGTEDAFSSITAKVTGLFMPFRTLVFDSITIPDLNRTVHTYPVSIGVESNNRFTAINAVAEVGWVPWYQSETAPVNDLIRHTKFGIFLQGGYKFKGTDSVKLVGGNQDQSAEQINNALFRAKGSFVVDTKKLLSVSGLDLGLVGSADLWYDFINSRVYHKIQGVARCYLTSGQYVDFIYAKGSGAPNFNQGDQWGLGLTIRF